MFYVCSECCKSVLILETRVQGSGAAESLEIGKMETGASKKSRDELADP